MLPLPELPEQVGLAGLQLVVLVKAPKAPYEHDVTERQFAPRTKKLEQPHPPQQLVHVTVCDGGNVHGLPQIRGR
jgi:hypothetical protein